MRNSAITSGASRRRKRPGNLILGIGLLTVGSLLFAREFGADLPSWLFRWEILVILVGISIGVKSGFRDFGWIAVAGVGFFFLSDDIFPGWNASRFIVPVAILSVGAFIILTRISPSGRDQKAGVDDPGAGDDQNSFRSTNPPAENQRSFGNERSFENGRSFENEKSFETERSREEPGAARPGEQITNLTWADKPGSDRSESGQFANRSDNERYSDRSDSGQFANRSDNERYSDRTTGGPFINRAQMEEEQLDIVSVFSAVNRKVFSKNFVGGEIVCVFGGSEVNLMNADISAGTIELEIVCIFGGATLFIPPNWHVRAEMGSVFGGIDDKRKNPMPDHSRTLIIKGVCIFGGLEVKSKYQ